MNWCNTNKDWWIDWLIDWLIDWGGGLCMKSKMWHNEQSTAPKIFGIAAKKKTKKRCSGVHRNDMYWGHEQHSRFQYSQKLTAQRGLWNACPVSHLSLKWVLGDVEAHNLPGVRFACVEAPDYCTNLLKTQATVESSTSYTSSDYMMKMFDTILKTLSTKQCLSAAGKETDRTV